MKVVRPKPFFYEGGNKAILLLHGFTGNTKDVRGLGRFLNRNGYTCHGPLYGGHGVGPEALMETSLEDWWGEAEKGYEYLKSEGYNEIVVAGVSLGAVFSLKLAQQFPVKALISMCAPAAKRSVEDLFARVKDYAIDFKKYEGKSDEEIEKELIELDQQSKTPLEKLQQTIIEVSENHQNINSPTFVIQGCLDDPLYIESAKEIYQSINTQEKKMKWYEDSGHIITLGKEKKQLNQDILDYLEGLNWS